MGFQRVTDVGRHYVAVWITLLPGYLDNTPETKQSQEADTDGGKDNSVIQRHLFKLVCFFCWGLVLLRSLLASWI